MSGDNPMVLIYIQSILFIIMAIAVMIVGSIRAANKPGKVYNDKVQALDEARNLAGSSLYELGKIKQGLQVELWNLEKNKLK